MKGNEEEGEYRFTASQMYANLRFVKQDLQSKRKKSDSSQT